MLFDEKKDAFGLKGCHLQHAWAALLTLQVCENCLVDGDWCHKI